jgi:hypothetical protein
MGIGVAALWVKEISRAGIIEALQNRRTFATTGDKMFIDLKIGSSIMGSVVKSNITPKLDINVQGQYPLKSIEILRNSAVIHKFEVKEDTLQFQQSFTDTSYMNEQDVLYYYVRATQLNKAIAWSSPIWIEKA